MEQSLSTENTHSKASHAVQELANMTESWQECLAKWYGEEDTLLIRESVVADAEVKGCEAAIAALASVSRDLVTAQEKHNSAVENLVEKRNQIKQYKQLSVSSRVVSTACTHSIPHYSGSEVSGDCACIHDLIPVAVLP